MSAERRDRPARWTCAVLAFVIAGGLALRWFVTPDSPVIYPVDAIYYRDVGRNIAAGRGVVSDYAWIYVRGVPDSLPMPANGYWMPGMAFYAAVWFRVLGPTALASNLVALSLAAGYMLAVWWLARALTGSDGAALLATALAAVEPNLLWLAGAPDACVAQGALTAAALVCMYRGLQGDARWLVPAGAFCGAAHLMRNDGVLLVPVVGLSLLAAGRSRAYRFRLVHVGWFLVPYAALVGPWLARNAVVFGSASPPGLWRLAFLPAYEDIFRADLSGIGPRGWLAYHGGWLGAVGYDGSVLARLVEWVALSGGSSLALAALAFQVLKRSPVSRPHLYLLALLTLAYGVVLPEIGLKGGFTRGYMSVLPWVLAAAAGGVWVGGGWLAGKVGLLSRPVWIAVLAFALLAHTGVRAGLTLNSSRRERAEDPYLRNAGRLQAFFGEGPDAEHPVLTDSPWVLHALTGVRCAMLPTDGMEAVLETGRRLEAHHVALPRRMLGTYPGLQEAARDGTLIVCGRMPKDDLRIYALPRHGGRGPSGIPDE